MRPYGRAADPGTIRGTPLESFLKTCPICHQESSRAAAKVIQSRQRGILGDLLLLSKVPSTAPEFPLGTQSEPTDLSRAPLDAFKMGVKIVDFRTILEPKVTRSRQSGVLRGPRHPQGVPRTAQELPFGAQSGARDLSRVPNGPPMVPLGRLWAPFGRLLGRFG